MEPRRFLALSRMPGRIQKFSVFLILSSFEPVCGISTREFLRPLTLARVARASSRVVKCKRFVSHAEWHIAFISHDMPICLCSDELCPASRRSARWTLTAPQIIGSANSLRKNVASAPATPRRPRRRLPTNSHPETKHSPPRTGRISHERRNDVNSIVACASRCSTYIGPLCAAHTIIKRISVNNNCDCLVVRAHRVMAQLPGGLRDPLPRRRSHPLPTPRICGERRILRWNGIQFRFVTVEWAPGFANTCVYSMYEYMHWSIHLPTSGIFTWL